MFCTKHSHGIAQRKRDVYDEVEYDREERISLSFRAVRLDGPCDCTYPVTWQCDTWLENNIRTRNEQKYIYEAYEILAPHYERIQSPIYTNLIDDIIESIANEQCISCLEIGCSNGRYLDILKERSDKLITFGLDCIRLFTKRTSDNHDAILGNNMRLPIKKHSMDRIFNIEIVNYLSNEKHRMIALNEMLDILAPNGILYCVVGAYEQTTYARPDVFIHKEGRNKKKLQIFMHFMMEDEVNRIAKTLCDLDETLTYNILTDRDAWIIKIQRTA